MRVILVPSDHKTKHVWHSMRQICERVCRTLENPGYDPELQLTPRQALVLLYEQFAICRRILKIKEAA